MSTFLKEKDTLVSLPTGLDSQSFMQPCLLCLTILKVCVYCTETSGHLPMGPTTVLFFVFRTAGTTGSIVVCISPLTSLMMDQQAKFSPLGLRTEFVGEA